MSSSNKRPIKKKNLGIAKNKKKKNKKKKGRKTWLKKKIGKLNER